MIEATLCFVLERASPGRILLGRKKRGFGCGKLNGLGGKVRPGETPVRTIVREVGEEAGITVTPEALRFAGLVTFRFPVDPSMDHLVHVFVTETWTGEPRESAEMAPAWFPISEIPFNRMWDDDRHWLPYVLAGRRIRAEFSFAEDNETVASWHLDEF